MAVVRVSYYKKAESQTMKLVLESKNHPVLCMKPWIETVDLQDQLFRTQGHFILRPESEFYRFREMFSVSWFQLHCLHNMKPIEGCSEPVYRLLIRARMKEYTSV
jgi:hypothetical protein